MPDFGLVRLLKWLLPWEPSIVVVVASCTATGVFFLGSHKLQLATGRKILYWLGLISMYAVSQTGVSEFLCARHS